MCTILYVFGSMYNGSSSLNGNSIKYSFKKILDRLFEYTQFI